MDVSTAKAEIVHGKQGLREARQQDLWQEMIRTEPVCNSVCGA